MVASRAGGEEEEEGGTGGEEGAEEAVATRGDEEGKGGERILWWLLIEWVIDRSSTSAVRFFVSGCTLAWVAAVRRSGTTLAI